MLNDVTRTTKSSANAIEVINAPLIIVLLTRCFINKLAGKTNSFIMTKSKRKPENLDIQKEIESEEAKIKAIQKKIEALKRTLQCKKDHVEKLKSSTR